MVEEKKHEEVEKVEEKAEEEKAKKLKKEEAEVEEKEELELVEELPKPKPYLSEELERLLGVRKSAKSKKPEFLRQEWFRYKRLGLKWRKPRGLHSKIRRHFKYRPNVVSIGYGAPAAVRFYHPSGFQEKLVHNVKELENTDPKTHAIRIAHSVGTKKRLSIIKKADETGIRVLNRVIALEEEAEEPAKKKETKSSGGKKE